MVILTRQGQPRNAARVDEAEMVLAPHPVFNTSIDFSPRSVISNQ